MTELVERLTQRTSRVPPFMSHPLRQDEHLLGYACSSLFEENLYRESRSVGTTSGVCIWCGRSATGLPSKRGERAMVGGMRIPLSVLSCTGTLLLLPSHGGFLSGMDMSGPRLYILQFFKP